jgi:hypothetical protein
LPDGNTDVFIKTGAPFYPVVNAAASIRSLTVQSGAAVTIQTGVSLIILQ